VGEEHASAHPEILDKIADAELCFTIDPVDGTWNYAMGLPLFGVMLAVLRFGRPVFGMLYDPMVNDVILADTESRAMLQMPRQTRREVDTSEGGPLNELIGYVPLALIPRDHRDQMAATFPKFNRVTSLRCACHEARMLAQGNVDFLLFAKLTPWDQPAGVVVMQAAGGHVAMLDGSPYSADLRSGYLLAACNEKTWMKVRDTFDFLIDTPAET
jgi:fructose-1,6-bisphosphatase/inositol monophosphatase family enzyme